MTDNTEQIGDLIYRPNPDYPYPFDVEHPPHFWMTEQTGKLEEAMDAYFNGDRLTPQALNLIKQYLKQYIERALMTGDAKRHEMLQKSAALRNNREIELFIDNIAEFGVEPF
jgi:hypothetical protein